jgi:hypothetical protein
MRLPDGLADAYGWLMVTLAVAALVLLVLAA